MSTMEQVDEVLTRYGQTVDLYFRGAEAPVTVKAFFQPVLEEKKAQYLPTPVGRQRQDRFLYLGPADIPLTDIEYMEWMSVSGGTEAAGVFRRELLPLAGHTAAG